MSEDAETPEEQQITVIGPDGMAVAGGPDEDEERHVTDLVEQPAKVMRIGSMIRQLLEEVKAAPLDESGRARLASVLETSVVELKDGLAPELDDELNRLIAPFSGPTPTESELRIAQATLVGWLEGLFHGIQTAIYAQQMAARAQLEQMRKALPPGMIPHPPAAEEVPGSQNPPEPGSRGGMYL
jgi:Bacterial proteasome activator